MQAFGVQRLANGWLLVEVPTNTLVHNSLIIFFKTFLTSLSDQFVWRCIGHRLTFRKGAGVRLATRDAARLKWEQRTSPKF